MPSLIVNLERRWYALLLQCHMQLMDSDPPYVATSSIKLYQNSEYHFFFLLLWHRIDGFSCCSIVLVWEMRISDVSSYISGNFTTCARVAGDWGASLQQIHCPSIQRQYGSLPREKGTNRRESRCPHFLTVYPKCRTGALYYSSFFARTPDHGGSGCSSCITRHAEAELETYTALLPLKEAQQPQQTVSLLPCR